MYTPTQSEERTNEANQVKTPAWVLMSFKKQQSVVKKKIYIYTCQNKQLLIICQNVIVYQNDGGKLDFKSLYGSSHFPKIREKSSLILRRRTSTEVMRPRITDVTSC